MQQETHNTDYAKMIRDRNLRVTEQRTTLLRLLCEVDGHRHLTAKELLDLASPGLPALNLATVYRTLDGLHDAGLVDRMGPKSEQFQYSFRDPTHLHGHLFCHRCGGTQELDYALIVEIARTFAASRQFAIDRDHLTLSGICGICQRPRS